MYTQCSKCETVFKLSAEVLRAAGGQVRCGRCGEVFSALARLAEEPTAFAASESPLDLEARADSILETSVAPPVAQPAAEDFEDSAPPGVEIARLEVLDWTEEEDQAQHQETDVISTAPEEPNERSMEFTLPPGELDKIFVEFKRRAPQPAPREFTDLEPGQRSPGPTQPPAPMQPIPPIQPPPSTQPHSPVQPLPPIQPHPSTQPHSPVQPLPQMRPHPSQLHPLAQPLPSMQPHPPPLPTQSPNLQVQSPMLPPSAPQPLRPETATLEGLPPRVRVSGLDVPEDVRRDMLEVFEQDMQPPSLLRSSEPRGAQRRPLIVWLAAAVVSTLLLAAQVVHQNRDWPAVRAMFGVLGAPAQPPANLSAYQLRQWGVTGDPNANGTLRLRASILNTAAQLQPYPLLRVTLADRFGKGIGTRDFEPSEYLGKPTARLLAPGERVDATLEILDPGKNAEGFEIDVCLRGADQRVACQSDAAPQTKR